MREGLGIGLIVAGGLVGGLVVVSARRRGSLAFALGALAVCGAAVGAGALLVQERTSGAEWAVTMLALGALTPLHAKLVFFRRPGRSP